MVKPEKLMRRPSRIDALGLPSLGFGAAHLGELYRRLPDEQAHAAIERAWDCGIRYFDTAPLYGHGLSERRLGNVLRHVPRQDLILSTKVGISFRRPRDLTSFSTAPWLGALPFEAEFDYTDAGVLRSYEQSLLRLGMPQVDALVIHNLDLGYHKPDVFEKHMQDLRNSGLDALRDLKASGEIKAIGAGVNQPELISRFVRELDLDFLLVAMPYTLLDQSALDHGLNTCTEHGVGVVIGSPFASGILTGSASNQNYNYQSAPRDVLAKKERIDLVCRRHGVSLPAAALRFPLLNPTVASVIPGMTSPEEVDANLALLNVSVPAALWTELREEGLIRSDAPIDDLC